ncbi:type I restriction-modification system subunit M [Niabella ginsenosidivorans]|uniref:site-specific DNA-methyltransferase (adenine-specific) n=1 Tax=Niabella ginsenosidivorans TaxID=1176587 RepID=A0A1A9I649_9BACT|nr:type I restriction-modification system subunit M [Niabella ginsenosidivorans]ANH83167.1 type I restriction-modification system subunit M [Niabella ginsenosidivorans]
MAIKKSELYSTIWASCDKLRGGMDASQYKDYVLVLLFIKYVSDKYAGKKNAVITIPPGASFEDMVKLKGRKDIGDKINKKIIKPIAEENGLSGIIDVTDFNDEEKLGKSDEMVDKLSGLISIFQNPNLDFSKNRADGDDILGDAYEYLMRHFATESGKSKGQFYTPAEVSRILAKILGINENNSTRQTSAYDPTCGSGSLLLKIADEAGKDISLFGQEKDVATAGIAKMNMILHNNPTADIRKGQSTLSHPLFTSGNNLKQFDYAVSNPPFSSKNWMDGFNPSDDIYQRFTGYGIPPTKNGDYAFLLHIIKSLKSNGKGAVILPHGVLFRGGSEAMIRKALVEKGYIKGIIGLPANLFYGTGIPACIIMMDKENAEGRKGIFMIDASKGFVKDGNKNRLREQDIHKIVDVFNKQTPVYGYSRMIPLAEIRKNEFNLNIPRYIDSQETEDIQDIEAHLLGGIPNFDIDALQLYWDVYPSLRKELFKTSKRSNKYSELKVEAKHIRVTIFGHPEFTGYANGINNLFNRWKQKSIPSLTAIKIGDKPKKIIHELSEDLLATFSGKKLLDNYDIYQHLMTYWADVMQDDVYILVTDGWKAGNGVENDKKKKTWEGRLMPKNIIINEYFSNDKKAIEELELQRDEVARKIEEMDEEHTGEDGALSEVLNDKGKPTKALIQKRIKTLEKEENTLLVADEPEPVYGEPEEDELNILINYLSLLEQESALNKSIKTAETALDKRALIQYPKLKEADIKHLVIEQKWMNTVQLEVQNEMDRISHRLAERIKELAERYETTLPQLSYETDELTHKVNAHLKKMGFVWK